jgi:TolB-like protein/DNA-binding winged helix-turn-helix (wHTH) protein
MLEQPPDFRFGPFEVRTRARELRKQGIKLKLRPQPYQILRILLEHPEAVVTRAELQHLLWPAQTYVDFEQGLNTSIKELRAALGDSPENSRYIATVPRLGYRFIAPVETIPTVMPAATAAATAASAPAVTGVTTKGVQRGRPLQWFALLAASAVLIMIIAGCLVWWRTRMALQASAGRLMVAVLPFENLTGDATQEYLSDGLTEEIIAQLGRLDPEHLGVIARTSVMHYKHTEEQTDRIGHELGVQYLLEGSVRHELGRVRVTAQLVQVKDQSRVWSREYDRELNSLLALQGEIAQETADEIQFTLGSRRKLRGSDPKFAAPTSYETYDLYLRGRFFWNKRTEDDFRHAADCFQQAIAKDPHYARAYAGLADTLALMGSWSFAPQNEVIPRARTAALRALQIDDGLAEAHTSLALIAENYDYDWQTAEREYRRAIHLDPQYATAHQWYAEFLSFQGRFAEALEESERARQLDPLSLIIATDHAQILYFSRQYDRAIEQFKAVIAMEPNFGRAHLVIYAYVEKGMFEEALTDTSYWHHRDGTPIWEIQAYIYGRWGKQGEAGRALAKCERRRKTSEEVATAALLNAYVATGKKEEAYRLIQNSYRGHSNLLTTLKVEPALDPLRGEQRFHDILRAVRFPQ